MNWRLSLAGNAAVRLLAGWLALVAIAASPLAPAAEPSEQLSRDVIERIVREYLVTHPEVIVEAMRALEERQRAGQQQRMSQAVRAYRDELLKDPGAPVGGNPQGDVTVVEFFDYRCSYCKGVEPTIKRLLQEDTKIRLVYKEFPILGPESVNAARAALAAHAQGKYAALHDALISAREPLTADSIMNIAGEVGLDIVRLRKDVDSPEITALVRRNHALAQALGVSGTPAFVIGDELVPGVTDLDTFKRLVEQARGR